MGNYIKTIHNNTEDQEKVQNYQNNSVNQCDTPVTGLLAGITAENNNHTFLMAETRYQVSNIEKTSHLYSDNSKTTQKEDTVESSHVENTVKILNDVIENVESLIDLVNKYKQACHSSPHPSSSIIADDLLESLNIAVECLQLLNKAIDDLWSSNAGLSSVFDENTAKTMNDALETLKSIRNDLNIVNAPNVEVLLLQFVEKVKESSNKAREALEYFNIPKEDIQSSDNIESSVQSDKSNLLHSSFNSMETLIYISSDDEEAVPSPNAAEEAQLLFDEDRESLSSSSKKPLDERTLESSESNENGPSCKNITVQSSNITTKALQSLCNDVVTALQSYIVHIKALHLSDILEKTTRLLNGISNLLSLHNISDLVGVTDNLLKAMHNIPLGNSINEYFHLANNALVQLSSGMTTISSTSESIIDALQSPSVSEAQLSIINEVLQSLSTAIETLQSLIVNDTSVTLKSSIVATQALFSGKEFILSESVENLLHFCNKMKEVLLSLTQSIQTMQSYYGTIKALLEEKTQETPDITGDSLQSLNMKENSVQSSALKDLDLDVLEPTKKAENVSQLSDEIPNAPQISNITMEHLQTSNVTTDTAQHHNMEQSFSTPSNPITKENMHTLKAARRVSFAASPNDVNESSDSSESTSLTSNTQPLAPEEPKRSSIKRKSSSTRNDSPKQSKFKTDNKLLSELYDIIQRNNQRTSRNKSTGTKTKNQTTNKKIGQSKGTNNKAHKKTANKLTAKTTQNKLLSDYFNNPRNFKASKSQHKAKPSQKAKKTNKQTQRQVNNNYHTTNATLAHILGQKSLIKDKSENQILFDKQKTNETIDQDQIEDNEELNEEINVKVIWQSTDIQTFKIRRLQKLTEIFDFYLPKANNEESLLYLAYNDKIIHRDDTPDSINYTIPHIDAGLLTATRNTAQKKNTPVPRSGIKIKFLTQNCKTPFITYVEPNVKLSHAMAECAEHFGVSRNDIIFEIDGEVVHSNQTPQDLEFEDEGCIDVKLGSVSNNFN